MFHVSIYANDARTGTGSDQIRSTFDLDLHMYRCTCIMDAQELHVGNDVGLVVEEAASKRQCGGPVSSLPFLYEVS